MLDALKKIPQAIASIFRREDGEWRERAPLAIPAGMKKKAGLLLVAGLAAAGLYQIVKHPPIQAATRGEALVRNNDLFGGTTVARGGNLLVIPGMHSVRRYSFLDQTYRPAESSDASGEAPFQSVEGLSLGVDISVRFAIDPARQGANLANLPENIRDEIVAPVVQGVTYKTLARYTVREIFSSKRAEIGQSIEAEIRPKLAAEGILLRSIQIGRIDLPTDYRSGMEKLLAEELESEKMRYTLELKEKRVKETALDADAEKIRREKAAEAAANEQIIAAKAQEEAMKHVLPFKQKQIEQKQLEAEADKLTRVKMAEANAQARRIESEGEADSRRKLSDAEVYRLERVGKANSEQMARDGELISKHPLLIQKTMADKLSDKISVIIAAPPASGGFIGANLIGGQPAQSNTATAQEENQ